MVVVVVVVVVVGHVPPTFQTQDDPDLHVLAAVVELPAPPDEPG